MVGSLDLERLREIYESGGVPRLERAAVETPPTPRWLDQLVRGASLEPYCVAATWVLRAYLQGGAELSRLQTAALLRSLAQVPHVDARLHICQLVAHLEIPGRNAEQLARFLREGAACEHKFTRAWATDALHPLGAATAALRS